MTHLRRYLEQTGALPPEQLDAALRRQQIYGGSLDTVVLELEICDPFTLNELLAQACGLQVVPVELLDNGLARPWSRLPEELIEIGWAVPLTEQGSDLWVAVHPDLPNERLGALYRQVPGVRPMVTPECCIEKIAAERTGSVVPQRYAVLCVSYVSALRRRPSVSDVSFPILPDLLGDESGGRRPSTDVPTAGVVERDLETRATTIWRKGPPSATEYTVRPEVPEPPAAPTDTVVVDVPVPAVEAVPQHVDPQSASALSSPPPSTPSPAAPRPVDTAADRSAAPPVRFTARGTMISTKQQLEATFEETDVVRRMAGARAVLASARTRDSAMDALVQAAMVVSPRIGVFRIRSDRLEGLSTPRSGLPDLAKRSIPLGEGTAAAKAVRDGRVVGLAEDAALREAVGADEAVPCVLQRIDVAGRPVMLLYIDHGGREFLPAEASLVHDLCEVASDTFEAVLKLRRAAAKSPTMAQATTQPAPKAPSRERSRRPQAPEVGPAPSIPPEPGAPEHDMPSDQSAERITEEYGSPSQHSVTRWGPAPSSVREAYEESASAEPEPEPTRATPGPAKRRPTAIAGSITSPAPAEENPSRSAEHTDRDRPPILTITAMPPPPPIPPPPPMAEAIEPTDGRTQPDTLMGLPPPVEPSSSGPRFIPPPLDDHENSGIISLASPIHQTSVRGRIELDDEEYPRPGGQLASESDQRRIDAVLRSIAEGHGDIEDLQQFGEPALLRLAAQFPGPLEILRRDLRALPPPSAHGPHIRTAIRLGAPMVPYLLDLLEHSGPDVRFYAAFVFQELRDPRCMYPLAQLAFDASGDVRVISMRVLETYSRNPGWDDAMGAVRSELDSANRTRQLYAARAVGTLRDIESIPKLIELLASSDRFIQEAALESLCSITGQQHGLKPHRWKAWFAEHGHRHRIEWVISSLKHRDAPVRRWAHDELTRVTGHRIPFSPLADKKSREIAAQAWSDWWESTGRSRFGLPVAGEYAG